MRFTLLFVVLHAAQGLYPEQFENYHLRSLRIIRDKRSIFRHQKRYRRVIDSIKNEMVEKNAQGGRFYFTEKITRNYDVPVFVAILTFLTIFTVLTVFMCCKVYSCSPSSAMEDHRALSILETMESRGLVLRPVEPQKWRFYALLIGHFLTSLALSLTCASKTQ